MAEESRDGGETDASGPSGPRETINQGMLDLEHVCETLAHSRRRYLIYSLKEDTEWSLRELATRVAAWEDDVPEAAVSEARRDRVYVSLYHTHVPKLRDEGVVAWDPGTETITAGEHAEQVLAALAGMGASLDASQEAHARTIDGPGVEE
ncbi:DUF7344 domain-containing protein [Halorarum halobium]|uniref:DUF7344 domain-containing protein n=1 Tax=Halorarum halobium TaxID=3075121 RepID=UPI0028AB6BA4|nr:hypothetical protein [Halobaculum sp. XH14]